VACDSIYARGLGAQDFRFGGSESDLKVRNKKAKKKKMKEKKMAKKGTGCGRHATRIRKVQVRSRRTRNQGVGAEGEGH